ncbi:MAG: hypothetical protein RMK18_08370 [Armatimonadota bacterium]|nr:hypothetical protein [Armatimonadota bacterium]MCX7777729.1 hypothetical protein [Armatimonadota bacterium]MDW8025856.1 hypothetical protein [Armatimonadota bacterium]
MMALKRCRSIRRVAWLLIVALSLTLIGVVSEPTSSEAPQQPAAGQVGAVEVGRAKPRIAILDFDIERNVPAWLGRAAADALAYAIMLPEEPQWEVVPRQQVQDALSELKIPPSPSIADIQRVGAYLNAQYVATGKVVSATVTSRPKVGIVHIQVFVYDVEAGEPVNGANVMERSPEGIEDTRLLADALNRAARRAEENMRATRLPTGQVLIRLPENRVLLNIGAKDAVTAGMRMSVIHTDLKTGETRKIGEIVVKRVEQRQSHADIDWETQGIQQMDKVRAQFMMPPVGKVAMPPIRRERPTITSWVQGIIFPLLALGALVAVIGQSRKPERPPAVLSAHSLSWGDGIIVRFGSGGGTVLGVEIYRGDTAGFSPSNATMIDIIPGNVTQYIDTTQYFEGEATAEDVDDPDRTPWLDRQVEVPGRAKRLKVNRSRQVVVSDYDEEFYHTPLELGRQYWYIIRRITARRPAMSVITGVGGGAGGGGVAWEIVLSQFSSIIGPATALRKMSDTDLVSPPNLGQPGSDNINLADVTFRFLSVRGADEYAIFVGTDPANLLPGKAFMKQTRFTQDKDGVPIEIRLVNELNQFFRVTGATTFYWRVGYRNSRDMAPPYPDGWVWSVVHAFRTAEAPPTPPKGGR